MPPEPAKETGPNAHARPKEQKMAATKAEQPIAAPAQRPRATRSTATAEPSVVVAKAAKEAQTRDARVVTKDVPAVSTHTQERWFTQNLAIREEFPSNLLIVSCPGCGLVGTLTLNCTAGKERK